MQMERGQGIPRNPFINAGALVFTEAIFAGRAPQVAVAEILHYLPELADDGDIKADREVAQSEADTGFRARIRRQHQASRQQDSEAVGQRLAAGRGRLAG